MSKTEVPKKCVVLFIVVMFFCHYKTTKRAGSILQYFTISLLLIFYRTVMYLYILFNSKNEIVLML